MLKRSSCLSLLLFHLQVHHNAQKNVIFNNEVCAKGQEKEGEQQEREDSGEEVNKTSVDTLRITTD